MAFLGYFTRNRDNTERSVASKRFAPSNLSITSKQTLRADGRNKYINILGWVIFLLAYGFFIPGIILPMYMYDIQDVIVHKTLWTTIEMVHLDGGLFPAVLVAFFGIAVPAIKLILVAIAHMRDLPTVSRFVVWISKWAIVDAIAACFIMAYYANAYKGAVKSHIESGFIFFVLYCVLSTVAALILDDRDEEFRDIYATRKLFVNSKWIERKSTSVYAVSVASGLTFASFVLNTVRLGMIGDIVPMSILSACHRLAAEIQPDIRPMILLVLFVVAVPVIELMFMGYMLYRPIDNFYIRCALRCLPQGGLLDVYAVSVPVMYIFLNPLEAIKVEIPPLGFAILLSAVGVTVFARFVLGRYLAKLFSDGLFENANMATDREECSARSSISSGVSVVAV